MGYDATPRAEAALSWAIAQAAALGTRLEILQAQFPLTRWFPSVLRHETREDFLVRARASAAGQGVTDVRLVILDASDRGTPPALTTASDGAQVLALGNHRSDWLAELTQLSITETTVGGASCPVVLIAAQARPQR